MIVFFSDCFLMQSETIMVHLVRIQNKLGLILMRRIKL